MKITYIGSPDFSADLLRMLVNIKGVNVSLVITQPDMPVGRKKIMTPTPVKTTAVELGIPIETELEILKHEKPDLVVLFAYGRIIPQWALDIPTFGFWNVHPSLLPHYRGASPISFPLLLGNLKTGTTIMQMDAALDHGDILGQIEHSILLTDTQRDLQKKLTIESFQLLEAILGHVLKNGQPPQAISQQHDKATFTRPLEKQDGFIHFDVIRAAYKNENLQGNYLPFVFKDWHQRNNIAIPASFNALTIVKNMYRGFYGWPGIWTKISFKGQEKRLMLLEIDLTKENLTLNTVQIEGKTSTDWKTFNSVYSLL